MVLAVLPGQPKAVCLDSGGQQMLSVLRQMGMPALVGVVTAARSGSSDGTGAAVAAPAQKMKERAAAKKRAAAVLQSEVLCRTQHRQRTPLSMAMWPHTQSYRVLGSVDLGILLC